MPARTRPATERSASSSSASASRYSSLRRLMARFCPVRSHRFPVAGSAQQAVGVDGGHAGQGQEDGLRGQEGRGAARLRLAGAGHGVQVGDVQLVGNLSCRAALEGNPPAALEHRLGQSLDALRRQEAGGGQQADAVVRGQEVEEGGVGAADRKGRGPGPQAGSLFLQERVQDQGRQGELVHQLRFLAPIAEIAQVLPLGHVGLREQEHPGGGGVQHGAQEAHQAVRPGVVQAGGAGLLPDVGHRVQAHQLRPRGHVEPGGRPASPAARRDWRSSGPPDPGRKWSTVAAVRRPSGTRWPGAGRGGGTPRTGRPPRAPR